MNERVCKYEFRSADGSPLPPFDAGAHIDVVVAPEYVRQYSLCGNPADHSVYQIGVQREVFGEVLPGRQLFKPEVEDGLGPAIPPPMVTCPTTMTVAPADLA